MERQRYQDLQQPKQHPLQASQGADNRSKAALLKERLKQGNVAALGSSTDSLSSSKYVHYSVALVCILTL